MKIVIAGGTGFLGSALASELDRAGHEVIVLTRSAGSDVPGRARAVVWKPDGSATGSWVSALDDTDAVVNLTGEPLPAKRWHARQKQRLVDTRVLPTRSLVAAAAAVSRAPRALFNASGVGYYPDSDRIVDESAGPGDGFLGQLGVQWEGEALKAETLGTRVVLLRSGVVLHPEGGAIPELVPPFRYGVGGPLGSGRQWWAWIHRDDWVRMVMWAIARDDVRGPMNVCAPEPARQKDVARAIGRALHRPAWIPAPSIALRIIVGEMAREMLLASQRAVPRVARDGGFTWTFPDLDAAVSAAVRR